MERVSTDSGISCVGAIPWGTHFCQFYEECHDLVDILVPYFKFGLDKGEGCLWVASHPLGVEDAISVLRAAVPDLDQRMKNAQIEIVDYREWYTPRGYFDADAVLSGWIAKKEMALARGFAGFRVTGNTFWIEDHNDFKSFIDYEARLNEGFKSHQMVCICSYCLSRSTANDIFDVIRNHEFAVSCRHGDWSVVESSALKIAKDRLRRANEELECRVADRTNHLQRALADKEVLLRNIQEREGRIRSLVDSNIIGILFWTLDGRVTAANDAFLDLVGYNRNDMLSEKINWANMTPPEYRAADERAIAELKATGSFRPFEKEYVRKDGSRVPVLVGGALFEGAQDEGVAFLLDLTERKQAEQRQKLLLDELNHRVKNTLATILAIAGQTLRTAESPEAFRDAFEGRLLALSQTHNLLTRENWESVNLRDVLKVELDPYANGDSRRFVLTGQDIRLGPVAAVTLGLAFHELATNTAKYGALSVPTGQIQVAWEIEPGGRLHLDWLEVGGPPVQAPHHRGFGLRLIERILPRELVGEVRLIFAPAGVHCTMDMSLDQVSKH